MKKGVWRVFGGCLVLCAVALLFCSKSSPGYPINDWSDANIYFSIGKGMARGQVVYRDLYDHKGPLLYAVHALCAWVWPSSFAMVYVVETVCAAAFLTFAYGLLSDLGVKRMRLAGVCALAVIAYTCTAFQQGDSAEELCLPLLMFSLWDGMRCLKEDASGRRLALHGALFGCVFWTKFTMIGLYAGLFLTLFVREWAMKGAGKAFRLAGWLVVGFVISTVPWVVYFGVNGAMGDWLKTYLYDNLFLYGGEGGGLLTRVKDMAKSALSWAWENPACSVLLAVGMGWMIFAKRERAKWERIALVSMLGFCALALFVGGKSYLYYGFPLCAFVPLGLAPICLWGDRLTEKLSPRACVAAGAACVVMSCAACGLLSPNVSTSFGQPRESTMQYQIAETLNAYESPTLLNYGFMDAGFFTASGIVPSVKYFHQTNVPLQEMLDEQTRYVQEGLCDFVITRGRDPEGLHERYELVATADSPDGFWYDHVYLYHLKDN